MTDDGAPVAWITGAGSGMGAATARSLAADGWRVALSGRRREALAEVAHGIREAGGEALEVPLDVAADDPLAAAALIDATWGRLDALVSAAGMNAPQRTWAEHDLVEVEAIVRTNLLGAMGVVTAALPALRRSHGVAVIVSSFSAWGYQPSAGVAYGASKSALATLVRSINTQEAAAGVRACHLCPGDVDSDFLRMRPVRPDAAARSVMLTVDDIARAVRFVIDSPAHVRIDELVISPISQPV